MPKTTKAAMKTTPKQHSQKVLDEDTSARVIAEYLNIEGVSPQEIDAITKEPRGRSRGLDARGIALVFRVSEVLGVPDPFAINPCFRLAFERARLLMNVASTEERAA